MFEVQKEETVNKTFRFPAPLVKRLAEAAQKNGVSMNELVEQFIEYCLRDLDEKDTNARK